VNYRTSHQIRTVADKLLWPEAEDVDGNVEELRGTSSVFDGPPPEIATAISHDAEIDRASSWIGDLIENGIQPQKIGGFVRSDKEMDRAEECVSEAGLAYTVLDDLVETTPGRVSIGTMHLAKGLEFRAVAVMACHDETLP